MARIVPDSAPNAKQFNGQPVRTKPQQTMIQMPAANSPPATLIPPGFPGDQDAANGPGDPGTDPVRFHPRGPDMRSSPSSNTKFLP